MNMPTTGAVLQPPVFPGDQPLRAYSPRAVRIQGDDWVVTGCDGEQTYVYLATRERNRKTYRIVEAYPGFAKPRTSLREVKTERDLELTGRHRTINEVVQDIGAILCGECAEEMICKP